MEILVWVYSELGLKRRLRQAVARILSTSSDHSARPCGLRVRRPGARHRDSLGGTPANSPDAASAERNSFLGSWRDPWPGSCEWAAHVCTHRPSGPAGTPPRCRVRPRRQAPHPSPQAAESRSRPWSPGQLRSPRTCRHGVPPSAVRKKAPDAVWPWRRCSDAEMPPVAPR